MLTTGADNIVGTSGNDTIQATDEDLTVFDAIDGGAGNDTLTLTFADDVRSSPAGMTVSAVENVTVKAAGSVGVVASAFDMSDWSGVTNVTVTGVGAGEIINVTTAASGTVSVTGKDDVTVTDDTAAAVTVKAGGTVDVSAEAATAVVVANGEGSVTVNAAALETLSLVVADDTEVDVTTESTALTINVAELSGVSVTEVAEEEEAVEALTINVTGDSESMTLAFAAATSLAVTGSADLDLSDESELATLASVTVAGSAGLTADLSGMEDLASIVSTSTGDIDVTIAATALEVTTGAGDDTITQAAALDEDQVINTGAGDDVVDLGAAPTEGATVNGGDGTDTIVVRSTSVTADHSDVISNFEVLEISGVLNADLDAADFDGIQKIVLAAGSAGAEISGISSGSTITYEAANTGVNTLTVDEAEEGTADLVNIVLNAAAEGTIDFSTIAAADVETLNVKSTTSEDPAEVINTVALDIEAETLNVTGDAELQIINSMTSLETVAAADFDAGLTVNLTGNENDVTVTVGDGDNDVTGGEGDDTITAGDGDNTIVSGNGDDTITVGDGDNSIVSGAGDDTIVAGDGDNEVTGGNGDDTITVGDGDNSITGGAGADTMTGGAGVDTYVFTAAADSQGVSVDTITNFDAAEDLLNFSGVTAGASYIGEANGYGAVLTSLSGDDVTEAVFDTSTKTLYIDINGSGTLDASDMAIQLTGVTDLDNEDNFVWTV